MPADRQSVSVMVAALRPCTAIGDDTVLRIYVTVFWIRDWTCFVRMLCMMDCTAACLASVVRLYAPSHDDPISAHHPLPTIPECRIRRGFFFSLRISPIDLLPYAFYRCLYELGMVDYKYAFSVWYIVTFTVAFLFTRELVCLLTQCNDDLFVPKLNHSNACPQGCSRRLKEIAHTRLLGFLRAFRPVRAYMCYVWIKMASRKKFNSGERGF